MLRSAVFKKHALLIGFIALGLFRLSLIGSGAMAFQDEVNRYPRSVAAAGYLLQGELSSAAAELVSGAARPADVVLRILPALLQHVLERIAGIPLDTPTSYLIPQFFNVLITLVITWVFFRISLLLFRGQREAAVGATVVFSLFANTNIYVRHLLGYDQAMLVFLIALWIQVNFSVQSVKLKKARFYRDAAATGVLAGLIFLIYPGYYFLTVLLAGLVLVQAVRMGLKQVMLSGAALLLPAGLAVLAMEGVTRFGGKSYLSDLKAFFSDMQLVTNHQGSYEEGFIYVYRYLVDAEGLCGVALGLALTAMLGIWLKRAIQGGKKTISSWSALEWIGVIAAVLYLQRGYTIYFNHSGTFYGRLIHAFYPIVVWVAMAVLLEFQKTRSRTLAIRWMVALSVFSLVPFLSSYAGIAYPRDVIYRMRDELSLAPTIEKAVESWPCLDYPMLLDAQKAKSPEPYKLLIVNGCFPFPVAEPLKPVVPDPATSRTIYSANHFMSYPPYQYEGYKIEARDWINAAGFKFSIHRILH